MRPIPRGFQDTAILLYASKIVDMKEILLPVSNIGIYCSNDKVGAVYLVKYIYENSTINISALCNSCEDMACCLSECVLTFFMRSDTFIASARNPFGIGHMYIYNVLPRMTDKIISQNICLSSWDILHACMHTYIHNHRRTTTDYLRHIHIHAYIRTYANYIYAHIELLPRVLVYYVTSQNMSLWIIYASNFGRDTDCAHCDNHGFSFVSPDEF
jgi:hypothetical protein